MGLLENKKIIIIIDAMEFRHFVLCLKHSNTFLGSLYLWSVGWFTKTTQSLACWNIGSRNENLQGIMIIWVVKASGNETEWGSVCMCICV